jgi:hypothetical protein
MSAPFEHVPPPLPPMEGELPDVHLPPWDREAVELGVDLRIPKEEENDGSGDQPGNAP